jgi:hypothetical protein
MFTHVLHGNRNGRFFGGNEMRKRFLSSLTWNWATLNRRGTISRRRWRWKLRRFCAAWPKMARKIIVSSSRPSALGLMRYSTSGMHSERIQGDFLGTAEDQVAGELMSLLARISFSIFIWVEIETCRSCES